MAWQSLEAVEMAVRRREDGRPGEFGAHPLRGVRVLRPVRRLLKRLRPAGTARDKAGNRELFYDQYMTLLLFRMACPALRSMRALQQATGWDSVRRRLGIGRVSLGSLSESAAVFDPELVRPIIAELARRAAPLESGPRAAALRGLTAVDGSVFKVASRLNWALWNGPGARAAKLHLHFEVFKSTPCRASVTAAIGSETAELRAAVEPGRLYVVDRGYVDYALFGEIVRAGSSLIARVKDNTAFVVAEERPVGEAARAAGVTRDAALSRLGTSHHKDEIRRPMRLVVVATTGRDGEPGEVWLITDRLDLEAELIAEGYRLRWTVELFFRWMKLLMGAGHLLSHSRNGATLHLYAALIVSLLIVLRSGRKPTKRTLEAIQFYILGWVTGAEFDAHLEGLKRLEKAD